MDDEWWYDYFKARLRVCDTCHTPHPMNPMITTAAIIGTNITSSGYAVRAFARQAETGKWGERVKWRPIPP